MDNSSTQNQVNKASCEYISIYKAVEKHCHFINEDNVIVFIDNSIVDKLKIDTSTVFEQVLTEQGILLRKIN